LSFGSASSPRASVAGFVSRRRFANSIIRIYRVHRPAVAVRPEYPRQKLYFERRPRHLPGSIHNRFIKPVGRANMPTNAQALRPGSSGLRTSSNDTRCNNGLGCLVTPLYARQRSSMSCSPSRGSSIIQCCSDGLPRRPVRRCQVRTSSESY